MLPKFGLILPPLNAHWSWSEQLALCRAIDQARANSIWVKDKIGNGYVDSFSILAALTGHIHRSMLVAEVTVGKGFAPQRHPALVAKAATSLDVLCSGRVMVALRAPLGLSMFTASASETPRSISAESNWIYEVNETITIMKIMFEAARERSDQEEKSSFFGKNWSIARAVNLPGPIQSKGPPIFVEAPNHAVKVDVDFVHGDFVHGDGLLINFATYNYSNDLEGLRHYIGEVSSWLKMEANPRRRIVLYGIPLAIEDSYAEEISSGFTGEIGGNNPPTAKAANGLLEKRTLPPLVGTSTYIVDLASTYRSVGVDEVACTLPTPTDPVILQATLNWLASH